MFSIEGGASHQFRSFDNVRIAPLPKGRVGGKHKATTSDGIGFSGMSSHDVPAGGLMEGEPSRLWLDDGKLEPNEKSAILNADLHVDEDQFDAIFKSIRDDIGSVSMARMTIAADLFERKVQASLSEYWMGREYGMLQNGDWVGTRTRLDNLHFGFGRMSGQAPSANEGGGIETDAKENQAAASSVPLTDKSAATETQKLLRALNKRAGWVLTALGALLIVTLLK